MSSRGASYTPQNDDDDDVGSDFGDDSYGSFGRTCMYIALAIIGAMVIGTFIAVMVYGDRILGRVDHDDCQATGAKLDLVSQQLAQLANDPSIDSDVLRKLQDIEFQLAALSATAVSGAGRAKPIDTFPPPFVGTASWPGKSLSVSNEKRIALGDNEVWPNNGNAEPTIAVHPLNLSILVADWVSFGTPGLPMTCTQPQGYPCTAPRGWQGHEISTSTDGGATWSPSFQLPVPDTSKYLLFGGDPVVRVGPQPDAQGHFSWSNGVRWYILGLMDVDNSKGTYVNVITYSDSDVPSSIGDWSLPILAIPGPTSRADNQQGKYEDKPWIAVDTHENSPYFGHVYLAANEWAYGYGEQVVASTSRDGGITWSAARMISSRKYNGVSNPNVHVDVASDGTVYFFFSDTDGDVVMITSTNGGFTYDQPKLVTTSDIFGPLILPGNAEWPGTIARAYGPQFHTAVIDPITNSIVMCDANATVVNGDTMHQRVVLTFSHDGGASFSRAIVYDAPGYSPIMPAITSENDVVVIMFYKMPDVPYDTVPTTQYVSHHVAAIACDISSVPVKCTHEKIVTSAPSDPNVPPRRDLRSGFMGDYNDIARNGNVAQLIFTDSRNGTVCDKMVKYIYDSDTFPAPVSIAADCGDTAFGRTEVWSATLTLH